MSITRRSFLRYCSLSAMAWAIPQEDLGLLARVLAAPQGPAIVWLLGSACTGCSISLLNRFSEKIGEPSEIDDVLMSGVSLLFHPTLMSDAGESAAAMLRETVRRKGYVLIIEGAVPMAFGGHTCMAYRYGGRDVTFQEVVQEAAAGAAQIICVGTCASFGGISGAGSNPTEACGVRQFTGRATINVSGCPANPDWIVWTLLQILLQKNMVLDEDGRPKALYDTSFSEAAEPALIHDKCPRNPNHLPIPLARQLGEDGHCLQDLGCRGPFTKARCEAAWNGAGGARPPHSHPGRWCVGVNAPCHGCVEKSFPGLRSFFEPYVP